MLSSELLEKLRADEVYRRSLADADIVTVFIGFNDFAFGSAVYYYGRCGGTDNQDCMNTIVSNLGANLRNIVAQIRSIRSGRRTAILLSDLYDPYVGVQPILVPFMNQMNSSIHSIADSEGLAVANVARMFNGPDGFGDPNQKGYIRDGVHPSAAGQAVIADQFRDLEPVLTDALIGEH